ncbi:TPA: hypothetical protein QDA71_003016 [Burkholderia vietnamiensis]|uniref:hypothetical protein n=1 Tax=Burkholderia cepacia complex TaxID=87882 RepID=UPI00158E262C|nr:MULTISPECIES: hypothetical protein [Burkholderia cepacia complex]MBR8159976.1 hypothetical protein [Burkholderia vietnamiensis]MCA8146608.1 hypothetical protein [Burkholderia vietnamiensis]MCO8430114.1 hypothetical protein [Burkholderia multivorans]MCO8441678.1 hypothetical protein [Burkholderia multivorans]MCO8547788.1 hypothetical protein [Burkholderia multivorans]
MHDELLSTQAAAEHLARELPTKSESQWALWLRNNRNQSRSVIYRVPVVHVGRPAYYKPQDLAEFIEFERRMQTGAMPLSGRAKQALQAFGLGEPGSTGLGRKWRDASANLAASEKGALVQFVITEPLMVFALSPEQAQAIGRELLEAGQAAQRQNAANVKGAHA